MTNITVQINQIRDSKMLRFIMPDIISVRVASDSCFKLRMRMRNGKIEKYGIYFPTDKETVYGIMQDWMMRTLSLLSSYKINATVSN